LVSIYLRNGSRILNYYVKKTLKNNTPRKITITKTRAIKIVIGWGRIYWSFWNPNRRCYGENNYKDSSYYRLHDDKEISQIWYDTIVELLETESASKSPQEFKIPLMEFTDKIMSRYNNGLVKIHITMNQAFVSDVVKVTDRGLIREMQTEDDCDCWFLIDGRNKCVGYCNGKPARIIYDGEKYYSTIEKTDKSCRIASEQQQLELSTLDKTVIDSALKLFLTLKEKKGG